MQSTIETSEGTKTWRNENKNKWKHKEIKNPTGYPKNKTGVF